MDENFRTCLRVPARVWTGVGMDVAGVKVGGWSIFGRPRGRIFARGLWRASKGFSRADFGALQKDFQADFGAPQKDYRARTLARFKWILARGLWRASKSRGSESATRSDEATRLE